MTPGAAAAFLAMSMSATRDQAEHWARQAADRGATPAEVAAAWDEWDRLQAEAIFVWRTT